MTSGIVKLPVGLGGTGIPATLTTRNDDTDIRKMPKEAVKRGGGLVVPVIERWNASMRMRPGEPLLELAVPVPLTAASVPATLIVEAKRWIAPPLPPPANIF
jgi:hypothetical protein